MKFIIKDWAGNILNFKGKFDLPTFAVPMKFNSFDDAWEYIYEHFNECESQTYDDFYVFQKES